MHPTYVQGSMLILLVYLYLKISKVIDQVADVVAGGGSQIGVGVLVDRSKLIQSTFFFTYSMMVAVVPDCSFPDCFI